MGKHITLEQLQTVVTGMAVKNDARFLKISDAGALATKDEVAKSDLASALASEIDAKLDASDLLSYTIKKQTTPETGYSATYQLFSVTADTEPVETAVGAKINIPKDMVVEDGSVVDITFDNGHLYDGSTDVTEIIKGTGGTATAADAGKYIKLVIANADEAVLYIKATDLVDVYTAGDGVDITSNEISVVIDPSNANGLSVSVNGIALALATPYVDSENPGSAGALSAADKAKIDNADFTPYTGSGAIDVTNHVISVAAASPSASGVGGAAGTMSAADKEKLDSFTEATDQEVQAILDNLWPSA